ncbi:MAG TPA: trigger factor [Casimicrobiaceae bacterium]|nr:trigger factor [Casimicrobiaceae bacterium]
MTETSSSAALERRLDVAVPIADIDGEVQRRLANLAKTVKVPGFRPGHVPIKMVAQQYGPQVRSDVISEAVQTRFQDAVRTQNLRIAGYPRIEPHPSPSRAGEALEFSAVFEVYPEITIGDLSAVTIDRPQVDVTDADVDRTIDVLRRQHATWHDATGGAAEGDRVLVDFTGTIDGVEFPGGQARDFTITLGEGRMLPEFEGAVLGMSAGEQKSFPLTFPADYHGKEVAGKAAQFSLTAKKVSTPTLPPLDEAFARSFGVASGSLADLRTEIAQNLELELARKVEQVVKEQALFALRAKATFAPPRSLVESEAQSMAQRMAENLRQQGMKPDDMKITPDMFREEAEGRVVIGLVLGDLVRNHGLAATREQVRARVEAVAQTYEQPDAVVRWHYEKPERLAEFETAAVERNVVDWVLTRARVVDRPTSFETLMGPSRS